MEMPKDIHEVYDRFLKNQCTVDELQELFRYFGTSNEAELRELIKSRSAELTSNELADNPERIEKLSAIQSKIERRLFERKAKVIPWKTITSAVASLLLISLAAIYWYKTNKTIVEQEQHISASDIKPGSFGATLTLSNGKKISLTEQNQGQLAEESGIKIIKSEDGQLIYQIESTQENVEAINTMETAPGQTYTIVLPDKSKVWLNAASSITYSTSIGVFGEERKVQLKGEAYFEIAKNEAKPFIVKTASQAVKVLGTHFNINSYSPTVTTTTLAEGSVLVSPSIASISKQKLKPGQKSILSKSSLNIVPANIEADLAWKNGLFTFDDATVTEVMQQISRWYNIEVAYSGAVPDERINGGISRQSDLNAVLKMLELININYKLERTSNGIKLIITP